MQKIKNIFALITLAAFLFPLVEVEVHSLSHGNDFHCTASDKHFHSAEHHCTLCDFTTDYATSPVFIQATLQTDLFRVVCFSFSEDNYFHQQKDFLALRAPPLSD